MYWALSFVGTGCCSTDVVGAVVIFIIAVQSELLVGQALLDAGCSLLVVVFFGWLLSCWVVEVAHGAVVIVLGAGVECGARLA